jgi:hypothetical protein
MKSGMLKGSMGVVVFLALLCALTSVPMVAQVVTGTLSGTVTDQTGAVVSGATVTLISQGSNAKQHATTSDSGAFRFTLLEVGAYDVEVTKPGFKKAKMTGAVVESNVEHGLGSIKLEIGQASESVEVTAAPPLVESTQAQISTTISGEALQTFAGISEGQGMDFIALTLPGVGASRDQNYSNSNGVGFSVDGIRGRNNDQQIDGQNNNDNSVAGPALFVFDTDFVQEYSATTGNFGPEYGRNSGSVINVVTKSGTNRWHGTVFGQETNSVLTALTNIEKDYEGITKPPRFNQEFSGGSIGGPLWKDRVFVFGGFDNQIEGSSSVFTSGGVLTPTTVGVGQLASCFPDSASVAALTAYGPFAVGGGSPTIAPGTIQTTDFNGFAVPNPNDGANGCNVQLSGVQRTLSNGFHNYDWIAKLDTHVSDSDSLSFRYFYQKQLYLSDYEGSGDDAAAGYPFNVPSLGQSGLIDWTHTFSNHMLNEVRIGYQRTNVEFGTNTLGTVPSQGAIGTALTNVHFSNAAYLGFGPDTNMPQGRIVNSYQLQDNFEYTKGRHQLKWGANITNQRSPNVFLPNYNGAYTFSDWANYAANGQYPTALVSTPNPVVGQPPIVTLAGASALGITAGNASYGFREWDTFLYVGDDWKVKSNLTLNLGLTWSYLGQPANLFHQETVKQQTGPDPFWLNTLPLSATTSPSVGTVYSLFGPSIGFAWSPNGPLTGNGKTVLRGGFRMTYDPSYYNTFLLNAISAPVVLAQTLEPTPAAGAAPPVAIGGGTGDLQAAPIGSAVRTQYGSSLATNTYDPRFFDRTVTPPTFRPDRYLQWSLGIQREVAKNAVVEVRYVGNHGNDGFQAINANPYIAGLAASYPNLVPAGVTPCPASGLLPTDINQTALGRVSCNAGITDETGNSSFSNYNALQAEFRSTNLFKQLTLRTNYTWSHTLDNVSEIFGTTGAGNTLAYSQNVLNYTGQEYGNSGINYPQTWTASFVEDIPFMRSQPGILGHILGGWAVSGAYIIQSGQGYTPVQIYINSASGGVANDSAFNNANNYGFDTSRPFVGSKSAPADQVGIYAGDACTVYGAGCALAANTLISLNGVNNGAVNTVTPGQVRLIANGAEADSIYGTPFGNVGRNSIRDFHTNNANFTLFKNIKFWERATLQWHMTADNVFNHPQYGTNGFGISPEVEFAGVPGAYTTFGVPQVTSTGILACPAGSRCVFFGLKVIY